MTGLAAALQKQSFEGTGYCCSRIPVTYFVGVEGQFLAALVVSAKAVAAAMAVIVCSRSQYW